MHPGILEKRANEFRAKLGFGQNDGIRLKSILARLGVITVYKPLSETISGMAIKIGDGDDAYRFLLVNAKKTIGHQHFTICHELYHLYIQHSFTAYICRAGLFNKKSGEEYNADLFSAFLLLPQAGIESLIPDEEYQRDRITLQSILKIEHYFSCSRSALLYRLKELGFISSGKYDEFNKNVKRGAIENGYTIDLYEPGNLEQVIGDYGSIARKLYDAEKISESHYLSLLLDLGMNADKIQCLNNVEE